MPQTGGVKPLGSETRRLIAELYRNRQSAWARLFGPRVNAILDSIAASGEVAAVPLLVPALVEGGAIGTAVARALEKILDGQPASVLARLEAERRGSMFQFDEWTSGGPPSPAIARKLAEVPGAWAALGALSYNRSGYVREAAVHALAKCSDVRAVPFLLLRMNDWVPAVREVAVAAMRRRVRPDHADALVACLPLVLALRKRPRQSHEEFVDLVVALLRGPGREALVRGARSHDCAARRACWRLLLDGDPVDASTVGDALADSDSVVRTIAARRLRALPPAPSLLRVLEMAAADHTYPVRREAIGLLLDRYPAAAVAFIDHALLDPHPVLRDIAVIERKKRDPDFDAALFYGEAIGRERGRGLRAAIAGLVERGSEEDVLTLLPLVEDRRAKVRRAALDAIAKLDKESVEVFVELLSDPSRRVSRAAAVALGSRLRPSVIEAASLAGSDVRAPDHVRVSAVEVIEQAWPWERLACLLRATSSPNTAWAELAATRIRPHTAIRPREFELASVDRALAEARIPAETRAEVEREIAFWGRR
jgi:HEAT repeat protein